MNTSKLNGMRRRIYTGLGVLAVLAMVCTFYYYYISGKEQKLQERNFRVLHRIEENFERRISDYRHRLVSNITACEDCVDKDRQIDIAQLRKISGIGDNIHIQKDTVSRSADWEVIGSGNNSLIWFYFSGDDFKLNAGQHFKIGYKVEEILTGVLRYDVFPSYMLVSAEGVTYNNCREVTAVMGKDSVMKNDNVTGLKIGSGNFYVFSHPFSLGGERGLVLSGIISAKEYAHDKYSVPGSFLLGIFLLMLVILLAFPFIKSFLVSVEETLNVSDILLALFSLFLLCYIYVFMHMSIFTVPFDEERKEKMLATTSDSISNSFLGEIGRMRRQLNYYDSIYATVFDTGGRAVTTVPDNLSNAFYPHFYRAFWVNNKGTQVKDFYRQRDTFTDAAHNSDRDYHDRAYFKAAQNEALWYPDSNDVDKVYLESVYSRIDGSFRAVMSKKSIKTPLVAGMSSEMYSVINTILPQEIDFCMLDSKGDILFTSTGAQHINENFLEECNDSREVSSALYSRASLHFERPFMGKDCSFYMRPVPGLPLYLVTFTYNEYGGNTQLQVCIYTSLFILAILILFSLVIVFLILLTRKPENKFIRRPVLDLSLLYPASNYLYRDFGGIVFNLILMAAMLICGYICRDEPLTLIFLLLINASGTTAAFCNARLDLAPSRRAIFWVVTILFFLLCNSILLNSGAWDNKAAFISLVMFELLLVWVIWQLRMVRYYEKDFEAFASAAPDEIYQRVLVQVQTQKSQRLQRLIVRMQDAFARFIDRKMHHRLKFYNQFAFMLVTWFTLIALLPTVFVYRYMYNNEIENRIKSAQIDIARKWYDGGIYKKDIDARDVQAPRDRSIQSYLQGYYHTQLDTGRSCTDSASCQEAILDKLLNKLRLSMKRREAVSKAVYAGASDSTIRFCKKGGQLTLSYQNLLNHPESKTGNNSTIQSTLPGFPMPSWSIRTLVPLLIYLLAPIIFLALLFSVINFFLKRFFLFDILPPETLADTNYFNGLIYEKYQTDSFKLIILGVTASGKRDLVKRAVANIYNKRHAEDGNLPDKAVFINEHLHAFDLAEIDQTLGALRKKTFKKGDIIVLNHFEHNLAEKETNDKKFLVISAIFRTCEQVGAHLIILSNIHPSVFLNNQKAKTEMESFKAEDYINKQDYYNWTGLLSGFEIYIKPYPKSGTQNEPLTVADSLELYTRTKSRYIFYLSIWNSLDRIEKFVMYDLATDSLVNYRNKGALYSLYTKGLVVLNDMPEVMNEEFKTFILTEVTEEDVELEKQQSGSRSAWNTFRIPFLFILVGVLMFVFITQQETFNKVMAGLVAIAGCVPILLKLLPFNQEKKA